MRFVLALGCMLMAAPTTIAQPVLHIDLTSRSPHALARWSEVLEDPSARLTIEEVSSEAFDAKFQPSPLPLLWRPGSASAWWVRFSLQAAGAADAGALRLEVAATFLEHVTLWTAGGNGTGWSAMEAGREAPVDQRPIDHLTAVFPLQQAGDRATEYYLRVAHSNGVYLPLRLWSELDFQRYRRNSYVALGLFYGWAAVLIIYALFLALLLSDRAYLWFALTTAAIILFLAAADGMATHYLAPHRPQLREVFDRAGSAATMCFAFLFVRAFYSSPSLAPRFDRWYGALTVLLALLLAFGSYTHPVVTATRDALSMLWMALYAALTIVAWRCGLPVARYAAAAVVASSTIVVAWIIRSSSPLDPGLITTYGSHLAFVVSGTVLAFGLAARVRTLAAAREQERLSLRDARARAEAAEAASRAKSEVLADMSHQIRTPLNAIIGFTQLLATARSLDRDHRQTVRNIEDGGNRLLSVVDEVLDLAKIEARRLEVKEQDFDLGQTLVELEAMFRPRCAEKGLRWLLDASAARGQLVRGDEDKLSQVLGNLLSNAIKFTDTGEVSLHVSWHPDDRYRFVVADTGVGIPAADVERIFDPFGQTSAGVERGGTGIGLTIARRLIEQLGGTLVLLPGTGGGARFACGLRLPPGERAGEPEGRTGHGWQAAPDRNLTALVVDDDAASRDVLVTLLGQLGIQAWQAADGAHALAAVRESQPDAVFMDMRLPTEDGTFWARRMWQQVGPDLSIIATSASVLAHQRAEYLAAGFHSFLEKPILLSRLTSCCRQLFGGADRPPAPAGQPAPPAAPGAAIAVALPPALLQRLREAAQLASVTDLEHLIEEVAARGGRPADELAAELRRHNAALDMYAIMGTLDRVEGAQSDR